MKKIITALLCTLIVLGGMIAGLSSSEVTGADVPAKSRITYYIKNVWELQNISMDPTGDYILASDINASITSSWNSGAGFVPTCAGWSIRFTGTFDGQNHTISGLYINRSSSNYIGLFGIVDVGGLVKNVGLINSSIKGDTYVGGLVGINQGCTVSNCHTTGKVSGNGNVGGLVGIIAYGTVSNCSAMVTTTGSDSIGGLLGQNDGGMVEYSYAAGQVSGNMNVGGLMGGKNFGSASVIKCYATGNVSGTGNIGGLIGYNLGNVILGVSNCYATGEVNGTGNIGGLIGYNIEPVSNSFWDIQTSGLSTSVGGTGKPTQAMKTESLFTDAGWDFNETWCMVEKVTYPVFRWQDEGPPTANAGPNQTVDEGDTLMFDASASNDEIGISNYTWTFNDGAGDETLYEVSPMHVFDVPGVYMVTLNVTDPIGFWDTDTMNVTVIDTTTPVADAGPDQIVDEGVTVTFDGSGSRDDVGVENYTWTFNNGIGDVTLYGVGPAHTFTVPGIFTVSLMVTDGVDLWSTDTMYVTVNDITLPDVNAGSDEVRNSIFHTQSPVDREISASASDAASEISNYTWSMVSGPGAINWGDPWALNTSVSADEDGEYVLRLTVLDCSGNPADDTFNLIWDTTAPVSSLNAIAGYWQTASPLTVTASATDTLSAVAGVELWYSYSNDNTTWGPWILFDTVVAAPWSWDFTFPFGNGYYGLHSIAMDNAGNPETIPTGADMLCAYDVEVPSAHAGPDQIIEEGNIVTFNGSGSKDNLGIVNYTWTFTYNGSVISLHGINPTFKLRALQDYSIRLSVRDEAGNSANDTMLVTVIENIIAPDADSDGDGWLDIVEILAGTDPQDDTSMPSDTDGDGIADMMDPDYLAYETTVYNNQTIYNNQTTGDDDTKDAGDDTETPTWAWAALAVAVILAVLVIILVIGRSGKGKKLEEGAWVEE